MYSVVVQSLFCERRVGFGVAEHLGKVAFGEGHVDVGDVAVGVQNRGVDGVDEALVRGDIELGVAVEHFAVERRIDLYGVLLDQSCAGFVVAFALYALDFAEELTEELAHTGVVVDLHIGLAVALHHLNHAVGGAFLKHPFGDELAVAHVGFLNVLARLDAHQLRHQAVEHIFIVLGLVGVGIVEQTELHQMRVGQIVEGEEVGARLLERRAVGLEGVGVNAGEQAAGAVAETFVEVGVEIVGYEEIFVEKVACGLVDYEFLVEAVAVAGVVVGLGDVLGLRKRGSTGERSSNHCALAEIVSVRCEAALFL